MSKFEQRYEVCKCKHVSLGEIMYAIEEKDAKTIKDIGNITDAGTVCGCCKSSQDDFKTPNMELYIKQILEKCVIKCQ